MSDSMLFRRLAVVLGGALIGLVWGSSALAGKSGVEGGAIPAETVDALQGGNLGLEQALAKLTALPAQDVPRGAALANFKKIIFRQVGQLGSMAKHALSDGVVRQTTDVGAETHLGGGRVQLTVENGTCTVRTALRLKSGGEVPLLARFRLD